MAKIKNSFSSLEDLKQFIDPNDNSLHENIQPVEGNTDKITLTIDKNLKLRVHLDRLKASKLVSRITGLDSNPEYMADLCKTLKQKCGVGGSVKDGEILIQGDQVNKIVDYLHSIGFKNAKRSGG